MISIVKRRRVQPGSVECVLYVVDQLVVVELASGDVDRDRERVPLRMPVRGLLAGLLEHPPSDRDDQPVLLGDRDEYVGGDDPASGVAPAQQRLDAGRALGAKIKDWLIDQKQLVALERFGEVQLEREPVLDGGLHR